MCPRWSRRELLHTIVGSAVVVTTGCVTQSVTGTPTEGANRKAVTTASESTPTSTPSQVSLAVGEPYRTADSWTVTVENVSVQASIVEFRSAHPAPVYTDEGQFVTADVVVDDVTGNAPDPAGLRIFVRTPTLDRSTRRYVAAKTNEDDVRQRVGFPVPLSAPPRAGAIVWVPDTGPTVRWQLPARTLQAIPKAPKFRLRAFGVKDIAGDMVEVTLTVENASEYDGTFRAELGDQAFSDQPEIAVEVPADESVTVTRRILAEFRDRTEATIVLRWRGGTLRRTVRSTA